MSALPPLLVVLTGPSGVGKDTVLSRMRELGKPYHFTVTATTRAQRPAERNGLDYIFITEHTFRQMVESSELLEWAEVYGNLYGVPKAQVVEAFNRGDDVIIKADVQGAATIKKLAPDAVIIFLAAPDVDELARRLRQRMTESSKALRIRLETAENEMRAAHNFDHVVVNYQDRLDDTVQEIESILMRERSRAVPRKVSL